MKKKILIVIILALFIFAGTAFAAPKAKYSIEEVTGHSNGNHRLDCKVVRPWGKSSSPEVTQYPVIAWANGWGQGNVHGAGGTDWYIDTILIDWVLDGPYIVIAANQWSAQESDVLACLQWMVDQNEVSGSEYEGLINTGKLGLAGHSQGGGAVVKAGDGEQAARIMRAHIISFQNEVTGML